MHPGRDTSGNFAQQLQHGAPFEVFRSADEGYVRRLVEAGHAEGEGVLYAVGRIGLFVATGSSIKADADGLSMRPEVVKNIDQLLTDLSDQATR